jgi:microcystin-dependent protein
MASGEIDLIPGRQLGETERVDNAKLNDMARPVLRIKEYAVTARELAPGAIDADKLSAEISAQLGVADGSVTTAKIVDNAVTTAKLAGEARIPAGAVMDFAGATPPDGWLLCGGQAVSRTTFANLYAAIGLVWGAGDGISTFNVPDLRGYVVAGKDDMATGAAGRLNSYIAGTTLGAAGGVEEHTLSAAEMPYHTHVTPNHSHSATVFAAYMNYQGSARGGSGTFSIDNTTIGVSVSGSGDIGTTGAGGGATHRNLQPTRIMNKIIRY